MGYVLVGYVLNGYVWDMCGVRYANNLLKNPAMKRLSGKTALRCSNPRQEMTATDNVHTMGRRGEPVLGLAFTEKAKSLGKLKAQQWKVCRMPMFSDSLIHMSACQNKFHFRWPEL